MLLKLLIYWSVFCVSYTVTFWTLKFSIYFIHCLYLISQNCNKNFKKYFWVKFCASETNITFKPYGSFPVYIMTIKLIDTFLLQERYAQNSVLEEIQYNGTMRQNINNVHLCIGPVLHSDASTMTFKFMINNLCIMLFIDWKLILLHTTKFFKMFT